MGFLVYWCGVSIFFRRFDLFCEQFSYEVQQVGDGVFAFYRNLDGGLSGLFVFLDDSVDELGSGFG